MRVARSLKLRLGLAGFAFLAFSSTPPAEASICFTSGKVYIQQKVYEKACWFLECARKGEPDNADSDACFAPRRAKPVFCPRLLFGVQEDRAGFAAVLIESRFQRCANRIRNALACFRLLYQGGAP